MRLIDADELDFYFCDSVFECSEAVEFAETIDAVPKGDMEIILHEVAKRSKPQWISVEDRLPTESDGTVLVCMPNVFPYNQKEPFVNAKHDRRVETGRYSEHSRRWYYGDMMSVGGPNPIAWMPIPEPPKDGEK